MFNLHSLLGSDNSCVPPKTLCVCVPCSFLHWIPPGCIQCGSVDYLGSASGPAAAGERPLAVKIKCGGCTVHEAGGEGGAAAGAPVSSAVSRQSAHYPAFSSSTA